MSNARIKKSEKRLVTLSSKIARLADAVEALTEPDPEKSKAVPYFQSVSFTLNWGNMRPQEETIRNGAEDVDLHGFTYVVTGTFPTAEAYLQDSSVGLYRGVSDIDASNPLTRFDFTWDWRILRSNQSYLSSQGAAYPLSRQSLGRRETQRHLYFKTPLLFEAGGALTVKMQPMCYAPTQVSDVIYVQMIAFGTRSGRMAEEVKL